MEKKSNILIDSFESTNLHRTVQKIRDLEESA